VAEGCGEGVHPLGELVMKVMRRGWRWQKETKPQPEQVRLAYKSNRAKRFAPHKQTSVPRYNPGGNGQRPR